MAQIRTTVRTEIRDERDEDVFVIERTGTVRSGNPTFHAHEANEDAGALLETVVDVIAHHYGDTTGVKRRLTAVTAGERRLSDVERGQVVTIGHPGNGRLAVRGRQGFRDVDTGAPIDQEDFRAGWDFL